MIERIFGTLLAALVAANTWGHGAHVHGEAQLSIAAEGNELHAEFESPAVNLVGFEHKPQNAEQERLLASAGGLLGEAESVLQFAGTRCQLRSAQIQVPHAQEPGGRRHHAHAHAQSSEGHGHSSFRASYRFQCDNLAALEAISVMLFARFPDIHKISVQWLTGERQGAADLTARNNHLKLRN